MSDIKKIQQQITDAALVSAYIKEAGHKARVKREHVDKDEYSDQLLSVLRDIGKDLSATGHAPKGMKYMGTIACHIYHSELLKESAFYKQITSEEEQNIALMKAAALELAGEIDFALTGKRPTKRSGFSG